MTTSEIDPKTLARLRIAAHARRSRRNADAYVFTDTKRFVERFADDFEGFCATLEIIPKSGVREPFVLNEIQRAYCAARTPRDTVLKPRQIGFTTLEQARDLWVFLCKPGARVVATCQSITDHTPAKLLASNYRVFIESLRRKGLSLDFRTESAMEWVLADRDASLRIVEAGASEAAAQKKGRAGTITRLHMTETAFYEYAESTLNAMLECVPAEEYGSEIVSESTANGAAGTFFEQCRAAKSGRSGYALHFFPWFRQSEYRVELDQGERIEPETTREQYLSSHNVTQEQIKWYRRKVAEKGQELTDQEYPSDDETCFLVSGRGFFDRARTNELIMAAVEPIEIVKHAGNGVDGETRVWAQPAPGSEYVVGVDTSDGMGGDPGAAIVRERKTGRHVATLHGQFRPWELARATAALAVKYNGATLAVERNNHGHAVLRALQVEQKYANIFCDSDEKPGWNNTSISRPASLDAMEQAHREGTWESPDKALLGELRTFVVNASGKAEAQKGAHDDLVMADMITWDVLQRAVPKVPRGEGWDNVQVFPY